MLAPTSFSPFRRVVLAPVASVLALAILAAPASARRLAVRDEARVHFIRSSGSQLIDEGAISGTIRGHVRIRFTYTGDPNVFASLTIYDSHGSIAVRATGRLSSPTSLSPSFKGHLRVASGTGAYAHASGEGELFGVFYRRNYGMVVQTIGTVHY